MVFVHLHDGDRLVARPGLRQAASSRSSADEPAAASVQPPAPATTSSSSHDEADGAARVGASTTRPRPRRRQRPSRPPTSRSTVDRVRRGQTASRPTARPTEDDARRRRGRPTRTPPPSWDSTPPTPPTRLADEPATDRAEAEADEAPTRPATSTRSRSSATALRAKPGDWYVVHTYSGMENRVKANLENRIISLNMEDYIHEIVVPTEEVAEIKNGQRKMVKRTVLPGYVLVRMDLTDESWAAVRHTPSVTGFVGHSHQPVPLSLTRSRTCSPRPSCAPRPRPPPARRPPARRRQEEGRGRRLRRRPTRSWSSTARSRRCTRRSPRSTPSPAGQGPRRDLRPGDPGRAELQPDPEGLSRLEHRQPGQTPSA